MIFSNEKISSQKVKFLVGSGSNKRCLNSNGKNSGDRKRGRWVIDGREGSWRNNFDFGLSEREGWKDIRKFLRGGKGIREILSRRDQVEREEVQQVG